MAAIQDQSAENRRSIAAAVPKLRDSCNACATSKLKCSKEKPVCARCVKRNIACEYGRTKRAGRKHGSQNSNRAPPVPQPAPAATAAAATAAAAATTTTTTATKTTVTESRRTNIGSDQDETQLSPMSFPDVLLRGPSLADPLASTSDTTDFPFGDILASPILFSTLNVPDADDLPDPCQLDQDPNGSSSLLNPNNDGSAPLLIPRNPSPTSFDLPTVPEFRTASASPQNQVSTFHEEGRSSDSSLSSLERDSLGPACCLIRSFALLSQLPSPSLASCPAAKGQGTESMPQLEPPTLQRVITVNEHAVQSISDILQCECSSDGYILTIMSIIVFKILAWYAAVVRQASGSGEGSLSGFGQRIQQPVGSLLRTPTVIVDPCAVGEDPGRKAAQRVLGELHRVQRLVNILSQRFKAHGRQKPAESSNPYALDIPDLLDPSESVFEFPSSLLQQIEVDLRKRLRALSAGIVDILR